MLGYFDNNSGHLKQINRGCLFNNLQIVIHCILKYL